MHCREKKKIILHYFNENDLCKKDKDMNGIWVHFCTCGNESFTYNDSVKKKLRFPDRKHWEGGEKIQKELNSREHSTGTNARLIPDYPGIYFSFW